MIDCDVCEVGSNRVTHYRTDVRVDLTHLGQCMLFGHWSAPTWPTWHRGGMTRARLSTTVDATLLDDARRVRSGVTDAVLVDEALAALLARHRAVEVDASYVAYDEHPLDEPDEWGDLASFRQAAAAS